MAGSAGARDNFSGDLSFTTPSGGYTAGSVYQLNSGAYGVARQTTSAGAACLVALTGAVWVTKATGTGKSFDVGDKVYVASNVVQPNATGGVLLNATVIEAATTAATKVLVELHGGIGIAAT